MATFHKSVRQIIRNVYDSVNKLLKIGLYDPDGNEIDSHLSADGGYHMGAAIIQSIYTSENNSTTENILAGETFIGESEETLGINGIQTYAFTDQNCTVYIEQSLDNVNWDISDPFDCLGNVACTRIFTSVAPYFRIKVTNTSTIDTTKVRIGCGMTPVINPLPRSLTEDDRLKVETTITSNQGLARHVDVVPTNSLSTITPVRLVGTNFDGTTKDTNFWTETITGSGAVAQQGYIELSTGVTANSTVRYETSKKARFVAGSAMKFQASGKIPVFNEDNIIRIGAFTLTDGFFYEVENETLKVVTRNNSINTVISNGSFNGNYGPTLLLDNNYHKLEIEWTPRGAFFFLDNKLLHKISQGWLSSFFTLPGAIENNNINSSIIDASVDCLSLAILRLGTLTTNSTYKYLGTNATTILKYGAGVLHAVINLDNAGDVTIYDGITAVAGTEIAVIDTAKALGTLSFDAPFSNGLTVVITSGAKITVTYE